MSPARSSYRVKSIFGPTLQGEGSLAGTVVLFLRLAGCNKWSGLERDRAKSSCPFCDTDFRGGTAMTRQQIVDALQAQAPAVKTLVISGGEPTLQLDESLLLALRSAGYFIAIETNGSRPLGGLRSLINHVTCSPKQSRAETVLDFADDLKILYPSPAGVAFEDFAGFPAKHRFLQPVWDPHYPENLKATLCRLYGNPSWRLSLQLHKIVGIE